VSGKQAINRLAHSAQGTSIDLETNMRKFLTTLIAALALASAAQAQYKSEYKLSVVAAKPASFGVVAEEWANTVRERTKGRINIKVYPNSMLLGGDQTREFSALRQGVIDMAVGPGLSWSAQVKEFNVFSLPFLINSNQAADAVVAGPVGEMIFTRLRELGAEPLAWGEAAFRVVANSKHPIRSPADLKGLKIRSIGSPLFTDFYTALGANPTNLTISDMLTALPTGAVDGVDQSVEGYQVFKLITLKQTHLTLLNYCWEPSVFTVNRNVWNSWSPEDREIVRQAALEQAKKMRDMKRRGLTDSDDSVIKEITAAGGKVVTLTPNEVAAFREATKGVYEKWSKQLDPKLVEAAEKSVATVRP
jgi:tripartite ATP-independent transporter DctP family solute receptor